MVNNQNEYRSIVILEKILNKDEIKLFVYSYSKFLKQIGAINITASIKNDFLLAYPIKNSFEVKFIEFSFLISPKALNLYKQKLYLDESILRFFIVYSNKKTIKKSK